MADQIQDVLRQTEAFSAIENEELKKIAGFSGIAKFEKGARLFKEGEAAAHLWAIAGGQVDLRFEMPARETTQIQTISTLSSHGIIGWSSLLPPYKYKLSAYCSSESCEVVKISGEQLLAFLKDNPETGYRVLRAMIQIVGTRFEHLQATADAAPLSNS
ncbi:MAG: cyclic nucleotide-binding domain-containing protein [Desulfosalsimonas sp.]|uniref:Crp/Fnr family transcriptional regulator n=1 Tax=Desulfosalsimonas sp. TaxID=3073848 RepID=UPI003970964E